MLSDARAVTGWLAHALLLGYWVWILSSTAPQLRRGKRDRALRTRVLLLRTTGVLLTAFVVGVINFWATDPIEVLAAIAVGAVAGIALRRQYRQLVAAPRHRLTLARRLHRHRHRPAHAATDSPEPPRDPGGSPTLNAQ
ncbi:hypothetical protein SAMN05443637_102204 [Pseudonocardia thermophila]|uniref:Uncharacterized protein n=1 Tax=Pseudonocardia thermophila TaxID=1848 RepID=A0A1M6PDJ2_PSETH|nr:hypothetical protein [Pseudonocardia thermophila]SHK06025.1 hypothetical protein SAMN05443637_102204 [Pseudonocardia thermophila]